MSRVDLLSPEAADGTEPAVRLATEEERRLVRASDRRAHVRRGASDLPWLRLVKLTGGTGYNTSLIDISEGGALLEIDGPLRPGSRLTLEISGTGLDASVPLEVVRSYVARLRDGTTFYRAACAFDNHITLPGDVPASDRSVPPPAVPSAVPAAASAAVPAAAPRDAFVGADVALMYILDRCVARGAASGSGPRVTLERAQLIHVLESIYARGVKDNSDAGARFVVELLGVILPALQSGASRNAVMAMLEGRMRAWPPSLQARLQKTRIRLASLIDRCAIVEAGNATIAPAPAALPSAGAAPQPAVESEVAPPVDTDETGTAFQRIVVRYLDGGIAKGFTQDFHPSRPQFSLWAAINAKPSERVIVPFANLKAVFFVRDFTGNAARQDQKVFASSNQGRRLEVTFMDTEVILGTTLNYRPDSTGFFVIPADAEGNNTRVFVVSSAIRRVRFF